MLRTVTDTDITPEIIEQLLAEGSEAHYLDFKTLLNPDDELHLIKLAKHIAAMQVYGGYIIAGVDNHGRPTGRMTEALIEALDQQKLQSKLERYLPPTFEVRTCRHVVGGHLVLGIVTPRHRNGFLVIDRLVQLPARHARARPKVVLRPNDILIRRGTSSERIRQEDIPVLVNLLVRDHREEILRESREHIAALREVYAASGAAGDTAVPLTWRLDEEVFVRAAGRYTANGDRSSLQAALDEISRDACALARALHEEGSDQGALEQALDRLFALGVHAVRSRDWDLLDEVTTTALRIYNTGGDEVGNVPSGAAGQEIARLRVEVAARVVCLGGALVRRGAWDRIRGLVFQQPKSISAIAGNDDTWLRHAIHLGAERHVLGATTLRTRERGGFLILRAQQLASEHLAFRPELPADDERVLDSLLAFDLLNALFCAVTFEDPACNTWYPGFAYWHHRRSEPIAVRAIRDSGFRRELFGRAVEDRELATALQAIGEVCRDQSRLDFGRVLWGGWGDAVSQFIAEALPKGDADSAREAGSAP